MHRMLRIPSGFREESEQDLKEVVKPFGSSYTWEKLAKYNEGITLTWQFKEK